MNLFVGLVVFCISGHCSVMTVSDQNALGYAAKDKCEERMKTFSYDLARKMLDSGHDFDSLQYRCVSMTEEQLKDLNTKKPDDNT